MVIFTSSEVSCDESDWEAAAAQTAVHRKTIKRKAKCLNLDILIPPDYIHVSVILLGNEGRGQYPLLNHN